MGPTMRRCPIAGCGVIVEHVSSSAGFTATDLVAPALRRNPRRAHLLVSTVLGKHIPTDPRAVTGAADRLGDLVADLVGARVEDALVVGFAETATGLGHGVATRIRAGTYLHSTRRRGVEPPVYAGFEEGHSHATSHELVPSAPDVLGGRGPVVLVDDETSTGRTAMAAIHALQERCPRRRYVIASLVDFRAPEDDELIDHTARELDIVIDLVSLARGRVALPGSLTAAVEALPEPKFNDRNLMRGNARRCELPWPTTVPEGGRHGFLAADAGSFERAVDDAASVLTACLDRDRPTIVVGHEELMYLPLSIAHVLRDDGLAARFQTTTRSPAYVRNEEGYPLRRGFRFAAPESGETAPRFLYNARWPGLDSEAQIVLVVDSPADTGRLVDRGGAVDVLTAAGIDVIVAALPPSAGLGTRYRAGGAR